MKYYLILGRHNYYDNITKCLYYLYNIIILLSICYLGAGTTVKFPTVKYNIRENTNREIIINICII